jgi:hypothetical protein
MDSFQIKEEVPSIGRGVRTLPIQDQGVAAMMKADAELDLPPLWAPIPIAS